MNQTDHPRSIYEKKFNKSSCSTIETAFDGEDIVPNKAYVEWLEENFTSTNTESMKNLCDSCCNILCSIQRFSFKYKVYECKEYKD